MYALITLLIIFLRSESSSDDMSRVVFIVQCFWCCVKAIQDRCVVVWCCSVMLFINEGVSLEWQLICSSRLPS